MSATVKEGMGGTDDRPGAEGGRKWPVTQSLQPLVSPSLGPPVMSEQSWTQPSGNKSR